MVVLYTYVYRGEDMDPESVSKVTINENILPISSEDTIFESSERPMGLTPPPNNLTTPPVTKR